MAYDVDTNVGKVRLLVGDISNDPTTEWLADTDYEAFLSMEDQNLKLAAANALLTLASNQAMILKVIERQDLDIKTDGAKLATAMRQLSQIYRTEGKDDEFLFEEIEVINTDFARRRKLRSLYNVG